jgi:DNA-binding HxlR family transcriptional regulator
MALLDLLGRRWTLRILWELREDSASFRELRDRCDRVSPTVLNQRLADLRDSGIVERRSGQGYALTEGGESLLDALAPLRDWARRWAKRALRAPTVRRR